MDELFTSLNGLPPNNTSTANYQFPPRRAYTLPHTAPLQVTTNVENDPSEATARPSNAHLHAQFHSLSLPLPGMSANSSQQPQDHPDRQLYGEEFTQATSLGLTKSLSRPLLPDEVERLAHLDRLKFFLATAPSHWADPSSGEPMPSAAGHSATPVNPHPSLYRFMISNQEYVSCVLWGNLFHITGTDIVRALVFRFEAFGRPVKNMKKFEEGVFSDLRNLKPGHDATLEEPKSPFLDLLFRHQSIRTQKKQKVFYWFSVPHDRLFLDALERDLKREKVGLEPTTKVEGEPALSFVYDRTRGLYEQFCGNVRDTDDDGDTDGEETYPGAESNDPTTASYAIDNPARSANKKAQPQTPYSSMFTLFEGSPTYKQRRKKPARGTSGLNMVVSVDNGVRSRSNSRAYGDPYQSDNERITHYDGYSAADMFRMQARGELVKREEPAWEMPDDESFGRGFQCPLMTCSQLFINQESLRAHLTTHQLSRLTNSSGNGYNGGISNTGFGDLSEYEINLTEHLVEGEDGSLRPVTRRSTGSSVDSYPGTTPNYPTSVEVGQDIYYSGNAFSGPPSSGYSGSDYDYGDRWALGSVPGSAQSFNSHLPSESGVAYNGNSLTYATNSSFAETSAYDAPPIGSSRPYSSHQSQYGSSDFSAYPTSVSAPSHQHAFDHEQFAHLRLSQSPNIQHMSTSSRPGSYHPSLSSSYSSHYPPSSTSGSPGSTSLILHESGTGPIRRHKSMTPSVVPSQPINMPPSNGRRPVTASSGSNGGEFAMMQQVNRGRGYHPYAGGYVSRSHSSASGSARSSPAAHAMALPMHASASMGMDQGGVIHDGGSDFNGMEMYRTDSPALVAYGGQREVYPMDLDSVNVGFSGVSTNGRYYTRQQGQQYVTL